LRFEFVLCLAFSYPRTPQLIRHKEKKENASGNEGLAHEVKAGIDALLALQCLDIGGIHTELTLLARCCLALAFTSVAGAWKPSLNSKE
jgi:hypothetical protein